MTGPKMPSGNGRPQRWMIVDDNREVLDFMREAAASFTDMKIQCFVEPRSALEAFAAEPDAFECVITDFDMPEMNGFELCKQIRQIAPATKVLLATGGQEIDRDELEQRGFCGWLRKPFLLTDLARVLLRAGIGKLSIVVAISLAM